MQNIIKWTCFCLLTFFVGTTLLAQEPETVEIKTESSEPEEPAADTPLDDVVEKKIMEERRVLAYQPLREADVFWQRFVWRIIDTREKMNLPFVYPEDPFFKIVSEAAKKGE